MCQYLTDESGKTLAIIIGLVAAVAIVIVFLAFIRRAGGVGGKLNPDSLVTSHSYSLIHQRIIAGIMAFTHVCVLFFT
jgi:hypothetical protein